MGSKADGLAVVDIDYGTSPPDTNFALIDFTWSPAVSDSFYQVQGILLRSASTPSSPGPRYHPFSDYFGVVSISPVSTS